MTAGNGRSRSDGTRAFLGVGWRFPLQVTAQGKIARAAEEQSVEESVFVILSTSPGERVMKPELGCGIHDLVFQPNNATTRSMVVDRVQRSLVRHEPRIDVLQVKADVAPETPNLLLIRVDYRIRSTNTVGNMVYPFYINEAE